MSTTTSTQATLVASIEGLPYRRNQHAPPIPMILGFVLASVASGILWALFLLVAVAVTHVL